jgi:ATP/maltotriose-dependent transcriptional regulator MalT/DNA-binding XRE family transcriptional regulator
MPPAARGTSPLNFGTFGEVLKYLRRRAQFTQRDLGLAVGYSEAQITRLEKNQRLPDLTTLAALFIPALHLDSEPELMALLLERAAAARGERLPSLMTLANTVEADSLHELGTLEEIPPAPAYAISRERDLANLLERLAAERCVALCGLAGMGKTTLGAALARKQALNGPIFWLTFTAGVTAAVEVLIRQLALFLTAHGLAEQVLPLVRREAGTALPLDQQMTIINAAFARFPSLICLDDAHVTIGDAEMTAVIRHLAATTPVSLLLLSRETLSIHGITTIPMLGLTQADGLALIARLAGQLDSTLAQRLLDKTGGSPMLLRLALGQIRDVQTDPQHFIDTLETQPQVAAYLLDTMLRDLSEPARQLVALLSVFRQPINLYDDTLVELSQAALQHDTGVYNLAAALAEAQRFGLIDNPAHANLHRLLRDHVYAALSTDVSLRKRLHLVAADWSERVAADALEAAYHYSRAGELSGAVEALVDQTQALINRGQSLAAVAMVEELLPRARTKIAARNAGSEAVDSLRRLLMVRGDLLINTLRAAEAETNYREALGLSAQPTVRAQVAARLAESRLQRSQVAEALQLCQTAAVALAPDSQDTAVRSPHALLLAQLAGVECQAHLLMSNLDEAQRVARYALGLIDQVSGVALKATAPVEARARSTLGVVANIRGQPQTALDHWERAIAAARLAGLRRLEYRCQMNIGILFHQQNEVENALRNFNEALAGVRSIGDSFLTARILHNISFIQHLRGEMVAALETSREACAIKRRMGDRPSLAASENQQAMILLALGRASEARALSERLLAEVDEGWDKRMVGGFWDTLGLIALVQRDLDTAQAAMERARSFPGAVEDVKVLSDLQHHQTVALLARGEIESAQQLLAQTVSLGGPEIEMEHQLFMGMVALAQGNMDVAAASAQVVSNKAQAIGYGLYTRAAARLMAAIQSPLALIDYPKIMWGHDA